jgi:predicted Zn-dependent peptidase
MLVYAGMAPGKAQAVVDLTIKELRDLRQKLVSSDELKRAKESMKGAVVLSLESSSSRMTNLAQQLLYFGEFISMQEVLDGFDTVNARDVRRLANEMFDSSYLTLTALGGENSPGLESVSLKV